MGNNSSSTYEANQPIYNENDYVMHSKIDDEQYGDITLMKHIARNQFLAQKQNDYLQPEEFESAIKELQAKISIVHPNLVKILAQKTKSHSNFCSNVNKISFVFEYFENNLEKEIEKRKASFQQLSEQELLSLLQDFAFALSFLEKNKIIATAIRPSTIMLDFKSNSKLPFHLGVNLLSNYSQAILYKNTKAFLSPELLCCAKTKQINVENMWPKANIFIVGLIMLEIGTLENLSEIFDQNCQDLRKNILECKLKKLEELYSKFACDLIRKMITFEPHTRISFDNLEEKLRSVRNYNEKPLNSIENLPIASPTIETIKTNEKVVSSKAKNKENISFSKDLQIPSPKIEIISAFNNSEIKNSTRKAKLNEQSSFEMPKEIVREVYEDGSIQEGEKLKGQRHGKGKFLYSGGGVYEGEWTEGRINGQGFLYYPSGKLAYEGEWSNDKFNGKGIVYSENTISWKGEINLNNFDEIDEKWVRQEGDFVNDTKEGIGTLVLINGDKFTGRFVNDGINGQGSYVKNNGEIVLGAWNNNKLQFVY